MPLTGRLDCARAPGGAGRSRCGRVAVQYTADYGRRVLLYWPRAEGAAQGEIESKHAVYVEEGARVNAKVTASEITVSGSVDGQIFSTGRVEIKPTGHVTGEINAASLIMQDGAYFDGQMKMKNRGEPDDGGVVEREAPPSAVGRRLPGAAGSRNNVTAD